MEASCAQIKNTEMHNTQAKEHIEICCQMLVTVLTRKYRLKCLRPNKKPLRYPPSRISISSGRKREAK